MAAATIFMLVTLAIALGIIAVVAVGMQGPPPRRTSGVAHAMHRTARHLNGDAPPPAGLVNFLDDRLRSGGSAASADTGEQPKIT